MNENNIRFGVVLLSAGTGSRMNSDIPKQYIVIEGHPVLYYSLYEFEMCPYVSEIVIVAAEQYHDMIMKDIVQQVVSVKYRLLQREEKSVIIPCIMD